MAQQTINIGASPNDGTGTPLRTSFDYTNQNFTELYTALGGGVGLPGATTQVIFNDGGTNLAGDAGLVYNKTTDALTVAGLVTAGSATVTGALTANGGVNLANATAVNFGGLLTIYSDTAAGLFFRGRTVTGTTFQTQDGTNPLLNISNSGIFTFSDGAGGTRMTLNSTGLGIGIAPSNSKLSVYGTGDQTDETATFSVGNTATNGMRLYVGVNNTNEYVYIGSVKSGANYSSLILQPNGGNVGIGVTPSAWGAGTSVIDMNTGGNAAAVSSTGTLSIVNNGFFNGTDWKYKNTSTALLYQLISGQHSWFTAASGTAGATITDFATAKMTLDASGNLLVGTTTANGRVAVDADLAVYNGMAVKNTGTTYSASSFFFRFINSSGVTAGSIQHTAVTTTNYSTTSDSRLKESKGISTDTSVIDNTIVRDFVWKADGSTDRGVFAQEAQSVKPRAISAGSDDLTEDGNIKTPWSVDYSKYVPDLIVYCQQLKKQVVELTARVQTLEAR